MKKISVLLCALCWSVSVFSLSGQAYMARFAQYRAWYQQLPLSPDQNFLNFIQESTPLANKLRDKWLYELARLKDWETYSHYYQPTKDINLECYAQIAKWKLGKEEDAINSSIPLWLSAQSQPKSCSALFDLFLQSDRFDQNLITQRIIIALEKHNVSLARYLLKQYKSPRLHEVDTLNTIYQNPASVQHIKVGGLNNYLILYGLKRLVSRNMDKALAIWDKLKDQKKLGESEKQAFIAHVALYKAMRNNEDAINWFAQIKPPFRTEVLEEWRIRYALKNHDWGKVESLIKHAKNKDTPCWTYWLARSLEKQGKTEEAKTLYEPLAKSRNYYGFLASLRLNKKPQFENEQATTSIAVLKEYQPILDEIKALYQAKHYGEASRLLNDFSSELPKSEASAMAYWVDNQLGWHGKSVFLSNNEQLNNQLSLRFPLAYKDVVKKYAQNYLIPPEFVYAIIRQESAFREDVVSSAGAKGLMQIMPYTARVVSKSNKIFYRDPKQLFQWQKNINIGVAYLQQLTKRFSNHPVLVAAAYNAGPSQVVYWLKNHPPKEIDIWIETLPWQETRNYLKNVMAFYVVYQYRLKVKPNLSHFLEPLD